MSKPWLIHFFRRHPDDDPDALVPVIDFLERVPAKAVAEIQAVLEAVAEAPPPAFSGGGKWEAMHGAMAGFYEVRVRDADRQNHRLFCVLERDAPDVGGPSLVCIDGLSKPLREAARAKDYHGPRGTARSSFAGERWPIRPGASPRGRDRAPRRERRRFQRWDWRGPR